MFSVVFLIYNHGCNANFSSDCDSLFTFPLPCPIHLKSCSQAVPEQNCFFMKVKIYLIFHPIKINCYDAICISILSFGVLFLLWLSFLYHSTQTRYVNFNTNLNLYSRKTFFPVSLEYVLSVLFFIMLVLLLNELESNQLLSFFADLSQNFGWNYCYPNKKVKFFPIITSF